MIGKLLNASRSFLQHNSAGIDRLQDNVCLKNSRIRGCCKFASYVAKKTLKKYALLAAHPPML